MNLRYLLHGICGFHLGVAIAPLVLHSSPLTYLRTNRSRYQVLRHTPARTTGRIPL